MKIKPGNWPRTAIIYFILGKRLSQLGGYSATENAKNGFPNDFWEPEAYRKMTAAVPIIWIVLYAYIRGVKLHT